MPIGTVRMNRMSAARVIEPSPGNRVPAIVENTADAQAACPAPYANIEESTDDGSRSMRLRSPVTTAQVSTSSARNALTIDTVSPTLISSKVLFSIISVMAADPPQQRHETFRRAALPAGHRRGA